jgi:hypothetical protein
VLRWSFAKSFQNDSPRKRQKHINGQKERHLILSAHLCFPNSCGTIFLLTDQRDSKIKQENITDVLEKVNFEKLAVPLK